MRIGIFHDGLQIPPKAGIPYRFYYLSKVLAEQGVEIVLFLCDRFGVDKDTLKNEPYESHLFSPTTFYEDLDFVESVVKSAKVDAIQVDCSQAVLLYGARYAQNLQLPLITEMHDIDSDKYLSSGGTDDCVIDHLNFVQKAAAFFSTSIICMTDLDKNQLIKLGVPEEKCTIAANGVDTNFFYYSQPKINSRKLLFLGNMFYPPNRKTAQLIIENVMGDIDADLICIGMAEQEFIDTYSSHNVKFVGGVDDIRPYLEMGTIAVAPIFEGSGMRVKFLNFASAGIPTVSTNIGISGYPEEIAIIENDIHSYKELILKLLKNPSRLLEQSKKAREIVEKQFSWESIAATVIDVYEKAKAQNKPVSQTPKSWQLGSYAVVSQKKAPLPLWLEEEERTKIQKSEPKYVYLSNKEVESNES